MDFLKKYYVRTRQKSAGGRTSPWSLGSNFTTKAQDKFFNVELQKVIASDGVSGDAFGTSVALSTDGSTLAVGAPYNDDGASNSGSVYIYVKSGLSWIFQKLIRASDFAATDYFGDYVSLSGDGSTLAVGAPYDDDNGSNAGAVYIFTRTGTAWTQIIKLKAGNGAKNDHFGTVCALSANGVRLIVGAPDRAGAKGSAYLFENFTWGWQQSDEILPDDPASTTYFGNSVGITGDGQYLLVGAYGGGSGSTRPGGVYVFAMPDSANVWWWTQQLKLTAPTPAANDKFGRTLAVSADGLNLLVGAYSAETGGDTAGAVYTYRYTNGTFGPTYKLMSSDRAANDWFGSALAISADGGLALIGAYGDDDLGSLSGSTYSFKQTNGNWAFMNKTLASDGVANDSFGSSVAVSGDGLVAAVSAPKKTGNALNTGAVYVYK